MHEAKDEISFKELALGVQKWWHYLLSKSVVVVLSVCLGGGIGLVYTLVKKTNYTGTLTFVLSNDSKTGSGLASLAGQFGLDVGGLNGSNGAFEGENIIQLLKSRRIIKGALFKEVPSQKKLLINILGEKMGFFKNWKKKQRLADFVPFPADVSRINPIQDSLIGVIHEFIIKECLEVSKVDKKLSFYQVTMSSPIELVSAYLPESVVNEAAKMYIETKTKTARENLKMLQFEADSLRGKLSGAIYSSASKVDQTFNLNPALQTQRAPIQQNQVQAQVLGTAYGEVVKNLEIAKITLQKETPLYQTIDLPVMPLTGVKLGKIKGCIIGGMLAGIICIVGLILRSMYKDAIEK